MTVKLTYFKDSGKYYSEGTYESLKEPFEIVKEVKKMLENKVRPGLTCGKCNFYVLIETPAGLSLIDPKELYYDS